MKRREFMALLGGAAAWPVFGQAQPATRRVAMLLSEPADEAAARIASFRQGLEKRGWSEGRNLRIDYRIGTRLDRAEAIATELIALQPDAVLSEGPTFTSALQRQTRSVPIVFTSVTDPIGSGFIASLARPGGNITGPLNLEASISGKWLQMIKEIAPNVSRTAIVMSRVNSFATYLGSAEAMASSLDMELVPLLFENGADIETAIESFARAPGGALILPPDVQVNADHQRVISLAAKRSLPAVYTYRNFVSEGGLMSYGPDFVEMFRQAAFYVDRILRGDKPAELPVQAPVKYETAVNLTTAKALGLTVPPGLLVAADEVIE